MLPLWLSLALVSSGPSADDAARRDFAAAVAAYGGGRYDDARARLQEAEAAGPSDGLNALIQRQLGLVEDALERRGPAVGAFMFALKLDPQLDLSPREHRADSVRLFDCARRLNEAGWKRTKAELHAGFQKIDWTCPEAANPLVSQPVPAPESKSSNTWIWVALGVVAAAGVGTAIAVAASGSDPYAGTSGVRIEL